MIEFVLRLAVTILCLGLVVVIHECGHFIVARWFGVRVERFTVGFGPEIFGWTKGDTRYAVCAVPLGGMVKLAGEYQEELKNKPDEFFAQPWYRRVLIALAGPVMNYILAFVLFAVVALGWGMIRPVQDAIIGETVPGMPAALAQLKKGDKVLSIDSTPMTGWSQMAQLIQGKPDQKLSLLIERKATDGKLSQEIVSITPKKDAQRGIGLIGVVPMTEQVKVGFKQGLQMAANDVTRWTMQPLVYLYQKIRSMEGPKELSGPIGIAQMVTKATQEGFSYVLYLIAVISTGLGLFNLFPIPILDGGHMVLHTAEGILRKPLSPKVMQAANTLGLVFVLTIFLYASYHDLLRWRGFGN